MIEKAKNPNIQDDSEQASGAGRIRHTFTHHPNPGFFDQLLERSAHYGLPLSGDQINLIDWHQRNLSSSRLDHALKYFLPHRKTQAENSFLLPHEALDQKEVDSFKKRVTLLLQQGQSAIQLHMTPEQFQKLREIGVGELIFYHGNQFLTGAPFHQGGVAHILFFQWGNLFGVAKYVVLADELSLKSNLLIHFENRLERNLEQCVDAYVRAHQQELALANQLAYTANPTPAHETQATYRISTPRLTLNPYSFLKRE